MSDGKEVKRWEPCLKDSPAGTYVTTRETKRVRNVYVTIEDHDRIVAEKDAEIARLKESLDWETALKRAFLDRHEEQTLEISRLNKELAAIEKEGAKDE